MRRATPPQPFGRGLVVPAILAVTTLGPACPGPDDPTPATTSGSTEPAPTATATPTTTGGTTLATGAPTSTGAASTTGGELPDCSLYNGMPETCSSMIECLYLANETACIVRCQYFTDQATCEAATFCYWSDGCYLAV